MVIMLNIVQRRNRNMKYNVGDKVRIKSLDWYNENKDEYGYVRLGDYLFTPDLAKYCGEEFTISHTTQFTLPTYVMIGNGHEWSDEMIEGLVEEYDDFEKMYTESEKRYEEKYSDGEYCHEQSFKWGFQEGCDYAHENEKLEINLKNGYQFVDENGNVINATKIVLEKKKKEYPKTYEECRDYIESCYDEPFCADLIATGYKSKLIESFARLLICRDAYWKIAGEEMGLGKPWNPDWENIESTKYVICGYREEIRKDISYYIHFILAFPTEEMRDAFYENFKELIEICKELL